jgi:hypothetical protein
MNEVCRKSLKLDAIMSFLRESTEFLLISHYDPGFHPKRWCSLAGLASQSTEDIQAPPFEACQQKDLLESSSESCCLQVSPPNACAGGNPRLPRWVDADIS